MQEYEGYWLKTGTILSNRYSIRSVLGEGGMGIVYLGYDNVLDTLVSIKEYFPREYAIRMQDETEIQVYQGTSERLFQQGMDRFIHEARTLAKFESIDSIVMVKDFFYGNGSAYMVMEYVVGENLKSIVEQEGKMKPEKVLELMKPILHALSILHKEGLLHRDISPDNIILRENGRGVLIDFGAARFSENQENKTMTVFFKRGYSAEEQYVEHSPKGAYTDVYGACATMYFMLTGIQPEESIRRLLRDNIVPLGKFRDISMPESAKNAIMKGMSLYASKRFETIDLLCDALYGTPKDSLIKKTGLRLLLVVILSSGIGFGVKFWSGSPSSVETRSQVTTQVSSENVITGQAIEQRATQVPTPEPVEKVPDVVGLKVSQAKKQLRANLSELTIIEKDEYSEKTPKGKVIRQSIKGGKTYAKGTKIHITLTVSKGKRPTTGSEAKPSQTAKPQNKNKDLAGVLPW